MKEFPPIIYSIVAAFLLAGVFALAAYFFVHKKKKLSASDIFLFIFWIVCVISFALIGILLSAFYFFKLPLENTGPLLVFMTALYFFQYFFILLYCLSKITFKKWVYWLSGFLFFIFLAPLFFHFLNQGELILRYGEPHLVVPEQQAVIYFIALLMIGLILFYFFIIWRDIKLGSISWSNLSPLYLHYSIIVLGAITFIRVFYFFPHSYIIQIFYLLVPYLVYLSRKDELRQK